MKRFHFFIAGLTFLLASCDSGVEWRGGPYRLSWIDIPDDVVVSYRLSPTSSSTRIEARVFAVGWDGHYLVAKQHPKGDKKITNYYIIDAQKDANTSVLREGVVIGPLSESEFAKKAAEMHLPAFSKELSSLK